MRTLARILLIIVWVYAGCTFVEEPTNLKAAYQEATQAVEDAHLKADVVNLSEKADKAF